MGAYKDIRQLQLLIQLFNDTFHQHILVLKNETVINCVAVFLVAMLMVHQAPLEAAVLFYEELDPAITFPTVFNNGFRIPLYMSKLKKKVLMCDNTGATRGRWNEHKRFYSKAFMSIASEGIKVGSFHRLERISTPKCFSLILIYTIKVLFTLKQ